MKITIAKLKRIIKEELSEITSASGYGGEDDDIYGAKKKMSDKMAAADIGRQPEGSRAELARLFRDLLGKLGDAHPDEVEALADTVAALIPASGENVSKGLGLEEGIENITPENLKLVYDVLVKMSPMLGMLAIGTPLLKVIMDKLEKDDISEQEKNNPYAICTDSVGREDKEKYEKCVMSVKRQKRGN